VGRFAHDPFWPKVRLGHDPFQPKYAGLNINFLKWLPSRATNNIKLVALTTQVVALILPCIKIYVSCIEPRSGGLHEVQATHTDIGIQMNGKQLSKYSNHIMIGLDISPTTLKVTDSK